ncbi:MAG: alpha/beta hydrolase [Leptospiraceae bacterium]|nr:MAG: alpha/beta hydrolase [Leptospiraceae bacterium]
MKLHYIFYPSNNNDNNLIILHGLFGSSKNWITIAKELSKIINVYTLDLRNHGNSPHSETHTLKDMILDLKEFIEDHSLNNIILMGHSMGGLVSMGYALNFPDSLNKLIVIDIAPKPYPPHHQKEFAVLKTDVSQFKSRQEIDQYLSQIHPDLVIRQFLMMNLQRTGTGYQWKINVTALEKGIYLQEIKEFNQKTFSKDTLFIKATDSFYITSEDYPLIKTYFPKAKIIELKGNHWLHYSNQKEFLKAVSEFIQTK